VKRSKLDQYEIIKALSGKYPVTLLCEIAEVSRSGYYKWINKGNTITEKQKEDNQIKELILSCHQEVNGIYGYYRVKAWLSRKHNLIVNHKRVYRLMKEMGIQARIRVKKTFYKKNKSHIIVENILNREFQATKPNEKWATDITYLMFNNRRLYLSVIYDLYNNEVVAYETSERNDLKLVMDTIKKAKKRRNVKGIILHSDQGFQYTSRQYQNLLKKYGIVPSMSRKGNCLDNACVENFFGHLKSELMYLSVFNNNQQVIKAIKKYIRFYNHDRFQKKLNNLSPIEYRTKVCA
jgi:transposase InsO family protein